jgi:hypothetical protein
MVRVHGVSKWSVILVEVGQWPVATCMQVTASRMPALHVTVLVAVLVVVVVCGHGWCGKVV